MKKCLHLNILVFKSKFDYVYNMVRCSNLQFRNFLNLQNKISKLILKIKILKFKYENIIIYFIYYI